MKKIISGILSVIIVISSLGIFHTSIFAANTETVLGQWDFDDESLSSKNNEDLLNALGWGSVGGTYPSNLKASVSDGGLRLQNTTNARADLLVLEDEVLREGFTLEYDFKYATQTSLPAAVGSNKLYNSVGGAAMDFMGGNEATDAATWHVQPRINGNLLNSPKTNSNTWVDITKMTPNYSNAPLGKWFSVRILFSPDTGVDVSIKERGATDWIRGDSYSPETLAVAKNDCKNFVSDFLHILVHQFVDVFVDNITVSKPKLLPRFVAYQSGQVSDETYSIRLIGCIQEKEGVKVGYKIQTTTYDETTGIRRVVSNNLSCNKVYRAISYQDGDVPVRVTADQLCKGMNYLFAVELKDLPRSKNHFYEVTPYIEGENGIEYGVTIHFGHAELSRELPAYDTVSGEVHAPISFSINNSFTSQVVGTNRTEMDAYVRKLENAGYTLYQSRDNVNGNYFRTLYNDTRMIHVYFMPAQNTNGDFQKDVVRIVTETVPLSEAFPKTPYGDAKVTDGSVSFMAVDGLGVVFTNPDGSYVIVDGGWGKCAADVYNFLKNNNKRTDGKILIRAWIVTHPHEDHWGTFIQFSKNYASKVKVEYVVTQLNQQYCNRNAQVYDGAKLIREAVAKFSGAKMLTPHTGQVMYFGELKMEFLYTLENLLNRNTVHRYLADQVDGNESSLVVRGSFGSGQTVLVTGDITTHGVEYVETMYKTHLKSDYITTPHHGVENTTASFYPSYVRPKVVFVPADEAFTNNLLATHANRIGTAYAAIQYVKANGGAYYVAQGVHHTFKIG